MSLPSMRNKPSTLAYGLMLMLGFAGAAAAQDNGAEQPSARQQLQHIHTAQSIDQELAHLTKDLELTLEQQQQVRPLLEQHHDKIQALLDKNPTASRQELGPQIHAISDETHSKIHALLTDHQKELEKAMQQREHNGGENRQSTSPAMVPPEPSSSASRVCIEVQLILDRGIMGVWPTQADENQLLFSNYSPGSTALPFVISTEAYPDFLLRAAGNAHVCGSP